MSNLSPIALFVYNRPDHTRRTVEALRKNELSNESNLIIFSDAAKSSKDNKAVCEVREYIDSVDGFKTVKIIERDVNYGLARSIIEGVSSLCSSYGKVIVLEDDLVTSPYFLTYMNDALNTYQDNEAVMHISGYMLPIDTTNLEETFFLRNSSCWGWATWDRSWKYFRKEPKKLIGEYTRSMIRHFNMDGYYDFWSHVLLNENGLINTWAIFWYASIHKQKGLCLHPASSMVNNIGHDGSGVNCEENNLYNAKIAQNKITYFENTISESDVALKRSKKFLRRAGAPLYRRILSSIKRRIF